jgi:hypothetical protein
MVQPDSPFDISQVAFPTDRLTLGDIRKRQPHLFTGLFGASEPRYHLSDLQIFATLSVERVLAKRAFAAAAGLPDPHPLGSSSAMFTRQEGVWMLNDDYKRYGLTAGLHQTREMVRRFEAAAAALGRTNHI